jgi:hypothetical protein
MTVIESTANLRNNRDAASELYRENDESVFDAENQDEAEIERAIDAAMYKIGLKYENESFDNPMQELYRLLDEGHTAVLEGRMRPHDEVFADLKRRIIDGTI